MTNNKELECLNKIKSVVEECGFVFPEPKKKLKNISHQNLDPLTIIKRVLGILKNATRENAEEKLDSLLRYLSGKIK